MFNSNIRSSMMVVVLLSGVFGVQYYGEGWAVFSSGTRAATNLPFPDVLPPYALLEPVLPLCEFSQATTPRGPRTSAPSALRPSLVRENRPFQGQRLCALHRTAHRV